jgi:hypothetical protein
MTKRIQISSIVHYTANVFLPLDIGSGIVAMRILCICGNGPVTDPLSLPQMMSKYGKAVE